MKIPVDIHVRSERNCTEITHKGNIGDRNDVDDFCVSGTMKDIKNGIRLEFSEGDGAVTTLVDIFDDQMVSINRMGDFNSHMVFDEGNGNICICNTGFIPLQMRIFTKSLSNNITFEGGKLEIDYNVEIVGNLAETNKISFSVAPDISIVKN